MYFLDEIHHSGICIYVIVVSRFSSCIDYVIVLVLTATNRIKQSLFGFGILTIIARLTPLM